MRNIVIIGNGIAGITCARHIRKLGDDRITVISSESAHFFSRTALMYIYMGHMKYEHTKPYEDFFWEKNRIALVHQSVTGVSTEKQTITLGNGSEMVYDVLVIATGSVSRKSGWPGQDLPGVTGLYSLQDLAAMEAATANIREAVVTGGGLIGVEMAEMLHTRDIKVTMLVKDDRYWAAVLPPPEAKLVASQIEKHGIHLIYNTQVKEFRAGPDNRLAAVVTNNGDIIPCDFAGIATGVTPNIKFLDGSGVETDRGVQVNTYFETNCRNVYAIGDCVEFNNPPAGRTKIEQVWYTGRMHGETLARTICGQRTAYQPGPWFNSAKFFDLEYQTYGLISGKIAEAENYFFWKHPLKDIAFSMVWHKDTGVVKGVNSYGMRLKHASFDSWLKKGMTPSELLPRLQEAVFDREFSKSYVRDIITAFNAETGSTILLKKAGFSLFRD